MLPRPFDIRPLAVALGAALALVGPQGAHAQALPKMLESALAIDPAVASAQAQVQAQHKRLKQARAFFGPTVAATGGYTASNYREEIPGTSERHFATRQVAIQVNQPLFRSAQWLGIDAAQTQLEQAEAAVVQARVEAMQRLIEASFDALKARDAMRLIQTQRVLTEEQLASAQRKFQLGAVPIPDVREAEARVDLVAAQLNSAEQELELRMQVLAELVGTKPAGLLTRGFTGERLPVVFASSILTWLASANTQSAQLRQAERAVAVAELEVQRARHGHMPTVDLTGSYQKYADTGTVTTLNPRKGDIGQLGVNVNVPLFASGATEARVEEVRALKAKAEADLANVRRNLSLQVRQAFSQTLAAVGQAKGLEAALRSAEVAYQANKRGYELGAKVTADVLDSQSRLFEVKRDLSRARYDAWNAFSRLKAVSGRLDELDFKELEDLLVEVSADDPVRAATPAARS